MKPLSFDYIIIGAGSAGCVLANRLSASGKYKVALVEAGGKDLSPWIHIPVGYFKTMGNPKTDWQYQTENDSGLNGRSIKWPRGRVLGGSSSINGLLYVRGQKEDFDRWQALGNPGWSFQDVLPFFKRSETWLGDTVDPNAVRGNSGPLKVSAPKFSREIVDLWIEAAVQAGYKYTQDYNGIDQEGVGYFQLTMANGLRCSSAKAYLTGTGSRTNLAVLTRHQVKKILINEGRAVGVLVDNNGIEKRLMASAEVILSAGAIGSPQILMLSGVGDQAELSQMGLENIAHLPGVGKNLQDHLQARPVFKTPLTTINVETKSIIKRALIALEFATKRTGPMTMAASLGTGFLKSHPALTLPDIQFHIQPFSANNAVDGPHPFSAFTASVLQLRPESSGYLKLQSVDYRVHPKIYPNYLSTKTDQDTIVSGIKIARKIAQYAPLQPQISEEYAPGPNVGLDDYDAILNWARDTSVTIYHPTGTCKMGQDYMAVVDARLRVHGVKGLRIADASIMPQITSGNTNAPTIMIGEKAADMILEDSLT